MTDEDVGAEVEERRVGAGRFGILEAGRRGVRMPWRASHKSANADYCLMGLTRES